MQPAHQQQYEMSTMIEKAFYSEHDLDALGILSRATRWRLRQSGDFPEPVKLSQKRVGYSKDDIDTWIKERSGGRS